MDDEQMTVKELPPEETPDKPPRKHRHKPKLKGWIRCHQAEMAPALLLFILIVLVLLALNTFLKTVQKGVDRTVGSFQDSIKINYQQTKADKSEEYGNIVYSAANKWARNKYQVTNDVKIQLLGIAEVSELVVMQVSDVEYVIVEPSEGNGYTTFWLEAPGSGSIKVNLAAAEFIKDDLSRYVLVRLPEPYLADVKVDQEKLQKVFFNDDIADAQSGSHLEMWAKDMLNNIGLGNGSIQDGQQLVLNAIDRAQSMIENNFAADEDLFESAKVMARTSIINLVRALNPEIDDLTVDVEFIS